MKTLNDFINHVAQNTKNLSLGLKMLAVVTIIAISLKTVGLSHEISWGVALLVVISVTCSLAKFPNLIGKFK